MGAGHSAEAECAAYASDPPSQERRKTNQRRRRLHSEPRPGNNSLKTYAIYTTKTDTLILLTLMHSVDSVASYSSQNHVDRIRTQNFSATSCQEESDFSSIKSKNLRRSSLEFPYKRPESVTSNTSSTRSRLREFVERKSQDDHKPADNAVGDIQYFGNPTETLEFDKQRFPQDKKSNDERPKKRKLTKSKDKDKEKEVCDNKSKKHEKYQSKLAEYYKLPVQQPQDEFYQHLTKSKAAEDILQRRFANSDTEFNESYGRLCKHKEPEGSNLRRSRSLAVIREETFNDLQIPNNSKNKRSQLIPRARLFDKPCFKDRLPGRAKYQTKEEVLESIYIDSTASCFGDINRQRENEHNTDIDDNKSDKEEVISRKESIRSRSITGSWPNLTEEKQTNLSEDSINHSRNPSEIDSLDSNYVRKHYNFDAHLKSNNYKDGSPETDRSSDTQSHSNKIYFNTDDQETGSDIQNKSRYDTEKSYTNDSISVTFSDKIQTETNVADKQNDIDSYDEISLVSKDLEEINNFETNHVTKTIEESTKEIDVLSVQSENDGTISSPPDSITSYISISIPSSAEKCHKLEYLANSLAEKIDEYCDSQFKNIVPVVSQITNLSDNCTIIDDVNPIYTKVNKKRSFSETKTDNNLRNVNYLVKDNKKHSDVYISNTYIENEFSTQTSKTHCSSSKNITTEPYVTTLIENQYYSLPDINISKCLRKSERIDAQLREEDPEDIPCENTYETAQSHFREILASKGTENYGQLNTNKLNNTQVKIFHKSEEYPEHHLIQNFTRLEDDLKSIITIDSSNLDDKDFNECISIDTQQNEREINEIEGTIRNNKVITKSESLKLASEYRFEDNNLYNSVSNDKIYQINKENKPKIGIKKHYSLRQREPTDGEIDRLPSPATVERSLNKSEDSAKAIVSEPINNHSLLSRVQSFKTSAESNIAIVPLSGHQTIVINPPELELKEQNKSYDIVKLKEDSQSLVNPLNVVSITTKVKVNNNNKLEKNNTNKLNTIDRSNYFIPKDPFITIKLNKVVKTTIPKLNKETGEQIVSAQNKFEKPPLRLIIKDNKSSNIPSTKTTHINMTRPQVMQVVDSKGTKQNNTVAEIPQANITNDSPTKLDNNEKVTVIDQRSENVKEKINNAIKTDIEYQEKLHSVKNYWSRLIDKTPESKIDNNEIEIEKLEEQSNNKEECKSYIDTTVGNIIKSIESVKIVDSIRKISHSKLQLWKDESEKVKGDSEIEETLVKKIVKDCEETISNDKNQIKFEKINKKSELDIYARDTPEIEIVELSSDDNQNQKTQATLIKAKGYEKGCEDFDHVRYKVMKSELFKNSMIANYRKEAQFDGLLQYLQEYSFQELLVNNNIVIIEPVRTKIEPAPRKNLNSNTCKISPTLLKKSDYNPNQTDKSKHVVRKHFFYHPIRVNKEIIEEELPNPDTVKKVRNLFEDTLKMRSPMTHDPPIIEENGLTRRAASHRNLTEDSKGTKFGCRKKVIRQLTIDTSFGGKKWDNVSLSSGVSSGDLSSNNEYEHEGLSPYPNKNFKDHVYSSSSEEYLCDSVNHDFCCESQYVSPDIMKKIRECGTSITYYGGKVLNSKMGSTVSPMTKAIMDEIQSLQKNCSRDCYLCQTKCRGDKCSCLVADKHKARHVENKQHSSTSSDSGNQDPDKTLKRKDSFPGFKFKLVKSNSCSSRLELTGTDESKNPRYKYRKSNADDPPLVNDDENSVRNKICRLESYNKGIAKTPFENKDEEIKVTMRKSSNSIISKDSSKKSDLHDITLQNKTASATQNKQESTGNMTITNNCDTDVAIDQCQEDNKNEVDNHAFEKKFYYVNDNLDQSKATPGKFGEMVFEEFEVLESCYDSLNSNKSTK